MTDIQLFVGLCEIAPAGLFRDGVARLLGDVADGAEVKCADYAQQDSVGVASGASPIFDPLQ
ncbi:hypothetical protein [Paraburkholderia elongata]|uniref:hypothetical protein n=1 Tax=Paraburkholderia elongata TaxID=2675747 RepID=UPI001551F8FB|nr:hypothetical protein [Paraburkholderia elongata]